MPSVPVVTAAAPSGAVVDKQSRARVLNPTTFAEHIFRPTRASAAALQRQRNSGTSNDLRRAGLREARGFLERVVVRTGESGLKHLLHLGGSNTFVFTCIPRIVTRVQPLLPVVDRYDPIHVRVL
jgi:hypothetical protein